MKLVLEDSAGPLPGLDLASLRVSKLLGSGGFATCWLATYEGQPVALKVMSQGKRLPSHGARAVPEGPPSAAEVELYERMFLKEAQITSQLEHRHIVRCLGVGQLPPHAVPKQPEPALAMLLELCESDNLRDVVVRAMRYGKRGYKTKQAYGWLAQIASALAHLHRQCPPIIHRDVKPENILLKRDGGELVCKLSDLGLHAEVSKERTAMLRRRSARNSPGPDPGPGPRANDRTSGTTPFAQPPGGGGAAAAAAAPSSATVWLAGRESAPPMSGGAGGGGGAAVADVSSFATVCGGDCCSGVGQDLGRAAGGGIGTVFGVGSYMEGSPFLTISAVPSFATFVSRTASRKEPCPLPRPAEAPSPVVAMEDAPGAAGCGAGGGAAVADNSKAVASRPLKADATDDLAPTPEPMPWATCNSKVDPIQQQLQPEPHMPRLLLPLPLPLPPQRPWHLAANLPRRPQPPQQQKQNTSEKLAQQLWHPRPPLASPFAAAAEQAPLLEPQAAPNLVRVLTSGGVSRAEPNHSSTLESAPLAPSWSPGRSSLLSGLQKAPDLTAAVADRAELRAAAGPSVLAPPRETTVATVSAVSAVMAAAQSLGLGSAGSLSQKQQQQRKDSTPPTTSPQSPVSPLAAAGSATISTLLIRHPEMMQAVPPSNPAAGLRQVGSLLRQLGKQELQELRRHEMEWVFGLTGKAGSFMYMAPEVYRNQPYNEKSDVFSFGVVAYELLVGEILIISVFNTAKAVQMDVTDSPGYAAKVSAGYRPPRVSCLSDAAWSLIESCWHQDPVQRPSMAEVEARLRNLMEEADSTAGSGGATTSAARLRGRSHSSTASGGGAAMLGRASRREVGSGGAPCCVVS